MLEAVSEAAHDALVLARWRAHVLDACAALGWPVPDVAAHAHRGGATLALSAPLDQLYVATEVNEWAWQRAAGTNDGFHAPAHPAPWDVEIALETLARLSRSDRSLPLLALAEAARAHGLEACIDNDEVSIGEGTHGRTWPQDALPTPEEVPWATLRVIPKALVTGSNGKTTTVRLVAATLRAQGLHVGHTCTDGIFVDGELITQGDWAGPAGARQALRHPDIEAAVLETARGGILRRGMAVSRADAAVVTCISADHFGEYGIHDLDDLAEVKLTVARAIDAQGALVLNADDATLRRHAARWSVPLAWFASDHDHALLRAHRAAGGSTCGVRDGQLLLARGEGVESLGRIDAMPLTLGGLAGYNVSNLAAAALVAAALQVPAATIASVFAHFGARHADNVGRLQRWTFGATTVLLDYAHNPDGLDGLLGIASALRGAGRLGLLLGQAGNRDDDAVRDLARTAARHAPDYVMLKDIAGYLRGRQPGEVAGVLRETLLDAGIAASAIDAMLDEAEAARALLTWAREGDIVVMPAHGTVARDKICTWLDVLAAAGWRAGAALPPLPESPTAP